MDSVSDLTWFEFQQHCCAGHWLPWLAQPMLRVSVRTLEKRKVIRRNVDWNHCRKVHTEEFRFQTVEVVECGTALLTYCTCSNPEPAQLCKSEQRPSSLPVGPVLATLGHHQTPTPNSTGTDLGTLSFLRLSINL